MYSIYDVPCDGNCLFSAITYQLESIGIQSVDAQTLRKMAVNYLRSNPFVDGVHYSEFVPEAVECDNVCNADTEAPSAKDARIAAIADSTLQAQRRWERYLLRLSDGAWGDNIAIQAIGDITIQCDCPCTNLRKPYFDAYDQS